MKDTISFNHAAHHNTALNTPLTGPNALYNALKLAADLDKERKALTSRVESLEWQIDRDAPKVEFYDAVKSAVNCQTMEQVAKKYGVGTYTLFELLRESKVLRRALDNPPYQRYIKSGHFKVEGLVYQVAGKMRQYNRTMVTGKGEIYIGTLLRKAGLLPEGNAT